MHKTQSALDDLLQGTAAHTKPKRLELRHMNDEPLPGYRLVELLGRGGFGEVWKCEVPGGLFKAVKFVDRHQEKEARGSLADQELRALERIKMIRHPYLLSIERVELVEDVLIVVMELADQSLHHILLDVQATGKRGLPRDRVLRLMLEAAEVLDLLHFEHGLQHLDIKPHNLFLVSQHVKVADFGLVNSFVDPTKTALDHAGGTPLYCAPERLRGKVSHQSDQYSLAITYQQLVTGGLPFFSYIPYELMNMHLAEPPDLSALSEADRKAVGKALAKTPEDRYPSCVDFVSALAGADGFSTGPTRLSESVSGVPGRMDKTRNLLDEARKRKEGTATSLLPANLQPDPPAEGAGTPDQTMASLPSVKKKNLNLPRLSLPGYDFLQLLATNRLAEVWTVRDPGDRERLAHCLLLQSDRDREIREKLQALRHPGLVRADIYLSPSGRLISITDLENQPLRAYLETRRREGQQGIPRDELLSYLRSIAITLDALRQSEGMLHLGLNPTNLVLKDDKPLIRDFGQVALAWLPTGLPAAQVNSRYAAPELHLAGHSSTSDQYSLGLIYAEMLTGVAPRAQRASGRSGVHRRPTNTQQPKNNSGNSTRSGPQNAPPRVDTNLLPVFDRQVVERATHLDPELRFASCSDFIEALMTAPHVHREKLQWNQALKPVVPVATLLRQPVPTKTEVPSLCQLVNDTLSGLAGVVTICNEDIRYHLQHRGKWSCRFPVTLFRDALRLRLQGFCQEWTAEYLGESKRGTYLLRVISPDSPRRSSIPGWRAEPEGLEIHITALCADSKTNSRIGELIVQLLPFGGKGGQPPTSVLNLGPKVVETLRCYLQPASDQRDQARWPMPHNLRVFPIQTQQHDCTMIPAKGKDLSLSGLGFYTQTPPESDHIYVHLYESTSLEHLALEAHVMRMHQVEDEWIEVGAAFALDEKDTPG